MSFPLIPSGVLFTELSSADRAEYFTTLAGTSAADVDMQAVFGRKGWLKRTTQGDPRAIEENDRLMWNAMSDQERYDFAYGNALERSLSAADGLNPSRAASLDLQNQFKVLSGGRPGNTRVAFNGDDTVSANEAIFKTIFGG